MGILVNKLKKLSENKLSSFCRKEPISVEKNFFGWKERFAVIFSAEKHCVANKTVTAVDHNISNIFRRAAEKWCFAYLKFHKNLH